MIFAEYMCVHGLPLPAKFFHSRLNSKGDMHSVVIPPNVCGTPAAKVMIVFFAHHIINCNRSTPIIGRNIYFCTAWYGFRVSDGVNDSVNTDWVARRYCWDAPVDDQVRVCQFMS